MRLLLLSALCCTAFAQQDDVIQRAMRDELKRSLTLTLTNLDAPYFIDYDIADVREFSASASLGGLLSASESHFRQPRVHVRVGDYKFDNTDYVGSGFNFGPRYDLRLPLEDSYAVLRQDFWLATDSAYKSALEAIARKRAALKNISVSEALPDFAPSQPFKLVEPLAVTPLPGDAWKSRIRSLSGEFSKYPNLKASNAEVTVAEGIHYYMNTEGTELRVQDNFSVVRLRAYAQAVDGMLLRDSVIFEAREENELPSEAEMARAASDLGKRVGELASAPVGENYSGPVLFEGSAGPQLFAEIFGRNLALSRKPVMEPGQAGAVGTSELEGRIGARVMPEFFNITDDPTRKDWKGKPLLGSYKADDEGTPTVPLSLVEKGIFKRYELTRQPMRGFSGSNGHARLGGNFGAKVAVPGNLLVSATETSPLADLKKKLIEMCQQRDKPYGIIVRKMDFPSSASVDEARRILGNSQGNGRASSLPLVMYRVYLDGHEELVRGMKFRGLNVRTFKDILAAGDDSNVFNYMENGAPFALMGYGSEFAEVSVVAPSILIDDLEMLKIEEEQPKLPLVPSPLLNSSCFTMRILSRYVFREVLSSSLLAVAVATFIVFLQGPGTQLLEVLVQTSASPLVVFELFLLLVPKVLPLTIPFGILVGILVGLGRMASDGEITAMRAGGISSRSVAPPVMTFCLIAVAVAGTSSLWLTPKAIQSELRIVNRLYAEKVTADIQPRVFDESFPKKVLYVDNVTTTSPKVWEHVFIADLTPPEERNSSTGKPLEGPKVTIAQQAIPTPDTKNNRIQLTMRNVNAHETAKDGQGFHEAFPNGDQILDATQTQQKQARAFADMPTMELYRFVKTTDRRTDDGATSRVELHSRFALPLACLMLGLVGIPLGIQTRKGGKSAAYVTAILLAFLCYYLSFITLTSMARKHSMSPEVGTWLPNLVFGIVGVIFIGRLEIPGDTDILGLIRSGLGAIASLFQRKSAAKKIGDTVRWRFHFFQILDTYILSEFIFYFSLWLASFVGMALIYNFFELLSDVIKNQIQLTKVFTYLFFLSPQLIYRLTPISVLVSVLVTFAILTKNNEVTAFKASGVSVRRLGVPILAMSAVLSAGLFGFDYLYIPEANTIQDGLRNEIKGKPVQTYRRKNQKWIYGDGSRIFYYRLFDDSQNAMLGVSVYELDPHTFSLKKEISAARAQWQPELNQWIFQDGWSRDLQGTHETKFEAYSATTFPELKETPTWFIQEVKQDKQMNYQELQNYIHDLQQRGFDTVPLRVQLQKKFAVPIFAFIMALISIPFAFLVGNRGAMAGIGVSIAIAMTYLGIDKFFEQIGNVNALSPTVAAWSPDALFALAGTYLLLRMRS